MASTFHRYSPRAKFAIYHAKFEAHRRRLNEIEPKDIVLGLTWDAHQPGCPFAELHVRAESIRNLLEPEPSYGPPANSNIPFSKSSKKVLAFAELEANRDRHHSIGSDHLRGVLRLGDETAVAMEAAGFGLLKLREASKEAHRLSHDALAPFWWPLKIYGKRVFLGFGLIAFVVLVLYLHSQN